MSLGYHLVLRTRDGSPLATSTDQRRRLARHLLETSKDHALLAFGLADQHLHLYPAEEEEPARELSRRVSIALTRSLRLAGGLHRSLFKPVVDGFHAYKLFDYVLRQGMRHQLESDPLLEATNLPDLLGLRLLGQRTAAFVRRFLPRVKRPQLLALYQVERLEPAMDFDEGELASIIDAGLAAVALPKLDASHSSRDVRRAVVEVVGRQISRTRLAGALDLQPRSLRRILTAPAPRELVRALRLQLDLRRQKAPELARLAASF